MREDLTYPGNRELASSRMRLGILSGVAVVVGIVTGLWMKPVVAALFGWDFLSAAYIVWTWLGARRLDPAATRRLAVSEDPGRAGFDILLLAASVASLAGVGIVIEAGGSRGRGGQDLAAGLAVASVVLSWSLVHTVFTERYARLYYSEPVGGVDFNDPEPPNYVDFAYLAFTIGMTFQVSDTSLSRKTIRATALRQALLSYLFGAVIIAATINLLAGLPR
ncbi:DUF1345 domain-containing protein [Rugosimonospora africana]|uniref:DUF1345 domain-containing protein n=1 Tax=Rugosimonospora africana TaxID=556532 RepID=A0A8J3VW61_9ACTN|nr:DUF1345 domain-containing protein [Rugosimonospora africana]GIH20398.1 hypothetical protein Raf01_85700 [Rugosimonospora africana]